MKVLLNFGPPSAYDRLAALRERGDLEVEEVQQQARTQIEAAQAELYVMAELERVDRQKEVVRARKRAAEMRAEEAARPSSPRRRRVPRPAPPRRRAPPRLPSPRSSTARSPQAVGHRPDPRAGRSARLPPPGQRETRRRLSRLQPAPRPSPASRALMMAWPRSADAELREHRRQVVGDRLGRRGTAGRRCPRCSVRRRRGRGSPVPGRASCGNGAVGWPRPRRVPGAPPGRGSAGRRGRPAPRAGSPPARRP